MKPYFVENINNIWIFFLAKINQNPCQVAGHDELSLMTSMRL